MPFCSSNMMTKNDANGLRALQFRTRLSGPFSGVEAEEIFISI